MSRVGKWHIQREKEKPGKKQAASFCKQDDKSVLIIVSRFWDKLKEYKNYTSMLKFSFVFH